MAECLWDLRFQASLGHIRREASVQTEKVESLHQDLLRLFSVFVLEEIDADPLSTEQVQMSPDLFVVEPELQKRIEDVKAIVLAVQAGFHGLPERDLGTPAFTACQYSENAQSAGLCKAAIILASGTLAKMSAAAVRDRR